MDKKLMRAKLSAIRSGLSTKYCQEASNIICQKIIADQCFINSKNIAFYLAINNEVNLQAALNYALDHNKNCFLPCIDIAERKLIFAQYLKHTKLKKNKYGILEPEYLPTDLINSGDLDLVFTPILGFDKDLNRLGMGMGYYDQTFSFLRNNNHPKLIGVAYHCQEAPAIIAEDHDIKLDRVITD